MRYEEWRSAIFDTGPGFDPVRDELPAASYQLGAAQHLDHVDRALADQGLHDRFTAKQIAVGLELLFNHCCSNFPLYYVENSQPGCSESRRVTAIASLSLLYENFYERYCRCPMGRIGDSTEGPLDQHCYMFWDVFVLHPVGQPRAIQNAALTVMEKALTESRNDHVLASAIHGLGHWTLGLEAPKTILRRWLQRPTTQNAAVLEYAKRATTGMIQ